MIIDNLIEKRSSPQNPATSLNNPATWLMDWASGGTSLSGIGVNENSIMTFPPIWRGVNLISDYVAKTPRDVYKRLANGGRDKDETHAAQKLIKYKPNDYMSAFSFWKSLTIQKILWGEAFAVIERLSNGQPAGLIPLSSSQTYPVRKNGLLWFVHVLPNGEKIKIESSNIIHLVGTSFDGVAGLALMNKGKESIGLGLAALRYQAAFFGNNARPDFALSHPATLDTEAKQHLRDELEAMHQGLKKSHRPMLLQEGMKVETFAFSNKDSEVMACREFSIREVANWLGIPPHKLGDNSKSSYNSLEQENQSMLDDTLDPLFSAIENELWLKLLTVPQQQQRSHFIEFNRNSLVRINATARSAYYRDMLNLGVMSRDEVRQRENLNPIPDGSGEKYLVPLNFGVLPDADGHQTTDTSTTDAPQTPENAPQGDQTGDIGVTDGQQNASRTAQIQPFKALLNDAVGRMTKRISTHAKKALKRGQDEYRLWVSNELVEGHKDAVAGMLSPAIDVCRAAELTKLDTGSVVTGIMQTVLTELRNAKSETDIDEISSRLTSKTVAIIIED